MAGVARTRSASFPTSRGSVRSIALCKRFTWEIVRKHHRRALAWKLWMGYDWKFGATSGSGSAQQMDSRDESTCDSGLKCLIHSPLVLNTWNISNSKFITPTLHPMAKIDSIHFIHSMAISKRPAAGDLCDLNEDAAWVACEGEVDGRGRTWTDVEVEMFGKSHSYYS